MERDPASASAEYLAQFRTDVADFVSRKAVESCVDAGVIERKRTGVSYSAFCDPSGGVADSMTLAIAHNGKDEIVLDVLREIPAPFNPESATAEFVGVLESFGIKRIVGDRYAGQWCAQAFERHGIRYEPSDLPKSGLYLDLLPKLNSRTIRLLDIPKAVNQICALERRTARGGRDSIDHRPGARDDLANVVAGVASLLAQPKPFTAHGVIDVNGRLSFSARGPSQRSWSRTGGISAVTGKPREAPSQEHVCALHKN
jgi:hypothetical protein